MRASARKSKGTKYSLADAPTTRAVEVGGITLGEIIFDIGGIRRAPIQSRADGRTSGGAFRSVSEMPVDYESLGKLGTIMGSGGMIAWMRLRAWSMLGILYRVLRANRAASASLVPARAGIA
jgi:NADH:ubiquinone oxidoreductase subunit F (NADH-binding)